MQTRRHILASVSVLAIPTTSKAKIPDPTIQSLLSQIVAKMQARENAQWVVHSDVDFILIRRKS
jgi:hypothetical protein